MATGEFDFHLVIIYVTIIFADASHGQREEQLMQKIGQPDPVSYLTCPDGSKRAYLHHKGNKNVPGVVFLAGHGSDMFGAKAVALHQMARDQDIPFLRFDYFGHGLSDGSFLKGTISQWVDVCVMMLDQLTTGPQILVGSSLGGWLMIRTALERRQRVAGLVGIAAAPILPRP